MFLDADDHIAPQTFERVAELLGRRPDLDGARFDWVLESTSGRSLHVAAWDLDEEATNLFEVCSERCPMAIHACVVRRSEVVAAGGFDESLIAAEDWDLWQRLGRRGVRLGYVPEILAAYVLRTSKRTNLGRVFADTLRMIERLGEAGSGVEGAPPHRLVYSQKKAFLWLVAVATGADADIGPLLDAFRAQDAGSSIPTSSPTRCTTRCRRVPG